MPAHSDVASQIVFGLDPFWVSLAIFVATYAVIVTERINRAVVALLGSGVMIASGVLNQETAIDAVDFNTLGLLTGMMVIVAITRRSGVFQYAAFWSAKRVRAHPVGILLMLSGVTALFSSLLDNVTTVLLVVPVTLLICAELKVKVYPYLVAEIFSSNIGGTATLIGDPPNMMIGSAANLGFNDFLLNIAPVVPIVLAATLLVVLFVWRGELRTSPEARQRIMSVDERRAITDPRLLKQSLLVLALVLIGFTAGHSLHLRPATVAMIGGALLLLLYGLGHRPEDQSEKVQATFGEVEWITIFFFLGLFIVVHGIERAGILAVLAEQALSLTGGELATTALAILWISAILSSLIDNIPFVATMIPMIESMAPAFGGGEELNPLWWSLALGACLGGNGTLVGASSNLIVAGFAERAGQRIEFVRFTLLAFPLMLISILIASVYVYLRYLV